MTTAEIAVCPIKGANYQLLRHWLLESLHAPLATYRGVAIRMEPPAGETAATVAVVLEHSDPALSLTLYRAADGADVVAEWRAWSRALAVPLLVAEADGRKRTGVYPAGR